MRGPLFVVAFCLFVALAPREPWSGATQLHLATARSLAQGTLDIAADGPAAGTVVHRGRRYERVPTAAVALLPAALLASLRAGSEPLARAAHLLAAATAAAAAALTLVLFFGELRRFGARPRAALWATALLGGATALLIAARVPDGTALATLLLMWTHSAGRRLEAAPQRRTALWLGIAGGLVGLVDPLLLPAVGVILAFAVVRSVGRGASAGLWALAPLIVGSGLMIIYRQLLGIAPEPHGDLIEGLDGLLLSTGKSVFLYNPPLVLLFAALPWWWRTRRADALVTVGVLAAALLVTAHLVDWHGDVAWGPRRLVPLLPIAMEPVALWLGLTWARLRPSLRVLVAAVGLAGAGVQIVGAAMPPETFVRVVTMVKNATGAAGWFGEAPDACHFIPQFSPLEGQPWLIAHALHHDRNLSADPPWVLLVPLTPRLDREWPPLRVDWWAAAWPRAQATALLTLLAATAIGAAVQLRRRLVLR